MRFGSMNAKYGPERTEPDSKSTPEQWKEGIQTWRNRAYMAYSQANIQLSKVALERMWNYQRQLAEMEGSDTPPYPLGPEEFFRNEEERGGPGWLWPKGRDPDQPAPVPRRPLPPAGSGEVALPEPEAETEDDVQNGVRRT